MIGAPRDFLGKEIRLGDTVVYPRRCKSEMWLRKAKVRSIRALPGSGHMIEAWARGNAGYRGGEVPAERCVVVVE